MVIDIKKAKRVLNYYFASTLSSCFTELTKHLLASKKSEVEGGNKSESEEQHTLSYLGF